MMKNSFWGVIRLRRQFNMATIAIALIISFLLPSLPARASNWTTPTGATVTGLSHNWVASSTSFNFAATVTNVSLPLTSHSFTDKSDLAYWYWLTPSANIAADPATLHLYAQTRTAGTGTWTETPVLLVSDISTATSANRRTGGTATPARVTEWCDSCDDDDFVGWGANGTIPAATIASFPAISRNAITIPPSLLSGGIDGVRFYLVAAERARGSVWYDDSGDTTSKSWYATRSWVVWRSAELTLEGAGGGSVVLPTWLQNSPTPITFPNTPTQLPPHLLNSPTPITFPNTPTQLPPHLLNSPTPITFPNTPTQLPPHLLNSPTPITFVPTATPLPGHLLTPKVAHNANG